MITTHRRSFDRPTVRWTLVLIVLVGLASTALPNSASAQGGIIDRIKTKAKEKTDAATDSLTDVAFDKATGAVKCVATNSACIKKAFGAGHNVKVVDAKGNAVSPADSAKAVATAGGVPESLATSNATASNAAAASSSSSASTSAPAQGFGDGVFLNYDFVPGDRVIFSEDFMRDKPGDFPKRLQLRRGNLEIAEWQGQHFLRTNSSSVVAIPLPEALPKRFTFEADYNGGGGWSMTVNFADPDVVDGLTTASFSPGDGGLSGDNVNSSATIPDAAVKPITHIAVMADSAYAKVYVNGVRVANVPNTNLGRGKVIVIGLTGSDDTPAYITNFRIAAGGKPLYDALMASGRASTHGILFATGSDQIRGESKPTLDDIGQMLRQHADLKLTIEGHTDNVGAAASNQTLSDKRAAAVRQFLISNYQIDASRLVSKGFGPTKPVASNDTPEGRQQNRRVDLVKN
jgi:OmpA-OmpF porin, OOP family